MESVDNVPVPSNEKLGGDSTPPSQPVLPSESRTSNVNGGKKPTSMADVIFILKSSWKFLFTLIVPLLLLPILFWDPPEVTFKWKNAGGKAAKGKPIKAPHGLYIMALMCAYWISECIPLAVTSLIPYALVPLFGINDTDTIAGEFFKGVNLFLMFGCIMALSFEYCNLHNRIAFFVMKSVGAKPSTLLFGLMMTCMLLSCWMNNTSTTAMMSPVIASILGAYSDKLVPKETPEELAAKFGSKEPSPSKIAQIDEPSSIKPMNAETGETNPEVEDTKIDPETVATEQQAKDPDAYQNDVEYWKDVINTKKQYIRNLEIMFYLGAAFASNIGGSGVLTGTGTNLIAVSELSKLKKIISDEAPTEKLQKCLDPREGWLELDFMIWAMLNAIPMVVNTLIAWVFLAMYFQGAPSCLKRLWSKSKVSPADQMREAKETKEVQSGIRKAIAKRHKDLGPMNFHEICVLVLFLVLVCLWVFNNPSFGKPKPTKYKRSSDPNTKDFSLALKTYHPKCKDNANLKLYSSWGWSRFFGDKCDEKFIHDYVPTMLICFLLFVIPRRAAYYKNFMQGGLADGLDDPLLSIDFVVKHFTWGPIIMLGGGFGMSATVDQSGLKQVMSELLQKSPLLKEMPVMAINAAILVGVAIFTSLASNTATALVVAPVLLQLGRTKSVPPPYFLVPPIVSASYAFALPISTPPNAIVYDKANMKQKDMFVPGFYLTVITNVMLFLFTISWYHFMFNIDKYDGYCDFSTTADSSADQRDLIFTIDDDQAF